MSVLIKGVQMPEDCWECRFSLVVIKGSSPHCCVSQKHVKKPSNPEAECPLFPLPERHGRLVDADALSDEYFLLSGEACGFRIEPLGVGGERATLRFKQWKDVPTVVEGEDGDEAPADVEASNTGHWIEDEHGYNRCSECGYEHDSPEYVTPYCPNCGADMREVKP